MNKDKDNYREQDSCYHCTHVFERWEYDSLNEYFCTFNELPRPKCCSNAMACNNECEKLSKDKEVRYKEYDEWEEWSKNKEVKPWAICDNFCKKILTEEELEAIARDNWNWTADQYNQWDSLGQDEKDELILAVKILNHQT